jgi:hypothetical protein
MGEDLASRPSGYVYDLTRLADLDHCHSERVDVALQTQIGVHLLLRTHETWPLVAVDRRGVFGSSKLVGKLTIG